MSPAPLELSTLLPPLILGTATFNSQYNPDPYLLPTTNIVHRALSLGVRAFDTSPYYGPAEDLLGKALDTAFVHDNFPRGDYFLLSKVGRIGGAEFDYSAAWVRHSIQRSLDRLLTSYLDVVYCHDVEFVSPEEVLEAVTELRRLRDQSGVVKYIGISGYPVTTLCEQAEMILEKTGKPLDAVMSYANFTLQNTRLSSVALKRLRAAGVDVVPNASVLGMGLLRRTGVPIGGQGDFHPSPTELRAAIKKASDWCDSQNDRIEKVAIRFALETWMREGESVGSKGDPASGIPWVRETIEQIGGTKLGVSVMGVSNVEELDETMRVWRSILDGLENGEQTAVESGRGTGDHLWSLSRQKKAAKLARGIRQVLGKWVDYTWTSPPPSFVNQRKALTAASEQLLTPAASPPQVAFKECPDDTAEIESSNLI
jgi:D-arabinose 1-dehydrogenase